MKRNLLMVALALLVGSTVMAQNTVTLKGVLHDNRYKENGETKQMESEYLGNSIFLVFQGIYKTEWDGTNLSALVRDPAVVKEEILADPEKAQWANNFKMMYANSGGGYVDGYIYTIMSRDEQSTTDDVLFNVRRWKAETGELLDNLTMPKSACLENCGIYVNPLDKKAYGLFYLTEQSLPEEITSDPDFFVDQEGDASSTDAGYCICEIDLTTLKLTPITPGLYYYNFITFAINSEGRAFAMTSGGANGTINDEGKMEDINGNLTGATLCEFDLATGKIINETASGYCSQYRRQAACFAKSNPNKMYWIGYFNSGKGIGSGGSWTTLPDKEWRTNGKYDTALYEIDVTTGNAERIAKIKDRYTFSCLWVDGDDCSDGQEVVSGITNHPSVMTQHPSSTYNLAGQRVSDDYKGIVIKNGRKVLK